MKKVQLLGLLTKKHASQFQLGSDWAFDKLIDEVELVIEILEELEPALSNRLGSLLDRTIDTRMRCIISREKELNNA